MLQTLVHTHAPECPAPQISTLIHKASLCAVK